MAPRTSATFAKRQKERARQEKQQAKLERKLQRKLEKRDSPPGSESDSPGSITDGTLEPLSEMEIAASETAITEREIQ